MSTSGKVLLHVCCAPCATSCLEKLSEKFSEIILFYYNPNIFPYDENLKRLEETRKLSSSFNQLIPLIEGEYDADFWGKMISPLSHTGEKGMRCWLCYYLRLLKSFEIAKENGCSFVATSLSISPHKNNDWIKEISFALGQKFGISFLDEKWNYNRSVELSKKFDFYRQDYCGCVFSANERDARINKTKKGA